jgi:hypothetical protein
MLMIISCSLYDVLMIVDDENQLHAHNVDNNHSFIQS